MWRDMMQIQSMAGMTSVVQNDTLAARTKRQKDHYSANQIGHSGSAAPGASGNPTGGSCCSCQVGSPGPPGLKKTSDYSKINITNNKQNLGGDNNIVYYLSYTYM